VGCNAQDLTPRRTVHDDFAQWDRDGTLGRIHHALFVQWREQVGQNDIV